MWSLTTRCSTILDKIGVTEIDLKYFIILYLVENVLPVVMALMD